MIVMRPTVVMMVLEVMVVVVVDNDDVGEVCCSVGKVDGDACCW